MQFTSHEFAMILAGLTALEHEPGQDRMMAALIEIMAAPNADAHKQALHRARIAIEAGPDALEHEQADDILLLKAKLIRARRAADAEEEEKRKAERNTLRALRQEIINN